MLFVNVQFQHHHLVHVKMMKKTARSLNAGHFVNEFDFAGSEDWEHMKVDNIIPQKIVSSSPMDATTFKYQVCPPSEGAG